MIPSTLAAEVSGALRDFLSTGFGPSNPALSDVVKDFLDDSDNLLKGPYLSVDLPFQRAPEGGEPFPETPLGCGGSGRQRAHSLRARLRRRAAERIRADQPGERCARLRPDAVHRICGGAPGSARIVE